MLMCRSRTDVDNVEPINTRSMLDAAATAAMTATADRPPIERRRRLSPAALAVTNQKVQPRLFADRDRGRRAPRRFRADQRDRHLALSRLCRNRAAASTGNTSPPFSRMTVAAMICFQAADIYEVRCVPRPAPADDADDLVLGLRVPAVHLRVLPCQTRQRGVAAVAVGVFLCGSGRPHRRTGVRARAGA